MLLCTVFAGFHENFTTNDVKTPVNSGVTVILATAVTVGIVLGILVTFTVTVCLILILRRRRYLNHFVIGLWVSVTQLNRLASDFVPKDAVRGNLWILLYFHPVPCVKVLNEYQNVCLNSSDG